MRMQSQLQAYDALTTLVYDVAADPSLWPKLLEQITESLHVLDEQSVEEYLCKHFDRALHLHGQSNGQQTRSDTLQEIINRLPIAVFVVKADASLLMTNRSGQQFIESNNSVIHDPSKFSLPDQTDHEQLHAMIRHCATNAKSSEQFHLKHGDNSATSLWLSSSDTLQHAHSSERLVTIYVNQQGVNNNISTEALMQVYGLTRAESRLLQTLTNHSHNLTEAAQSLGIKHHTARGYMKNIMLKTKTNSQTELLKRILSGPIPHIDRDEIDINQTTHDLNSDSAHTNTCHTIPLADGRQLAYAEYGDPEGFPVIYCHSLLGCRLECDFHSEILRQHHIRLIAPDRPGFGQSDITPDYDPLTWHQDTKVLSQHLQLQKFSVLTYSAGSLYGMILALAMPDRIEQLCMVSNVGLNPSDADIALSRPFNRHMLKLAKKRPAIFKLLLGMMSISMKHNIGKYLHLNRGSLCDNDHQFLESERFEVLRKSYIEARKQGVDAMAHEAMLYTNHVAIDARQITTPTTIWHGNDDRIAPLPIIQPLIDTLPNADIHMIDHAGHYLLFSHWGKIIQKLGQR